MKKTSPNINDDGNTVEVLELDNIFNFDKEQECYEGHYCDTENKIPYERWTPIERKNDNDRNNNKLKESLINRSI